MFSQACGSSYEVSDDEVDEGEVDKLVQSVLRQAVEVWPCTIVLLQLTHVTALRACGHGGLGAMLLHTAMNALCVLSSHLGNVVLWYARQNGIDDHFSARGKGDGRWGKGGGRAFRGHFLEAWDHLVREAAAAEILFDGFVLSKLLDLVMAMAKCAHAAVTVE
jgi:hypothetical protein